MSENTFTGRTEMVLNQSTMCNAMQWWLSNVIFKQGMSQKVTGVTSTRADGSFTITLEPNTVESPKTRHEGD